MDNEFISIFIEESIKEGDISLAALMLRVDSQLNNIDRKIKEVEELKKIRTKLLDVKSFIGKNYGH